MCLAHVLKCDQLYISSVTKDGRDIAAKLISVCSTSMCIGNVVMYTVGQKLFARLQVCCKRAKMRTHCSNKINMDIPGTTFSKMNALQYLQSVNRLPTPDEATSQS